MASHSVVADTHRHASASEPPAKLQHGYEDQEQEDDFEEERTEAEGEQQEQDKPVLARLRADTGQKAGHQRQLQAEEVGARAR